jgi:general secretion pathway protein K
MKRLITPQHGEKSSGLLLVLWAVGLISISLTALFNFVILGLETSLTESSEFRARQLAETGVAFGSHPGISHSDPLLNQKISPTESFNVEISDETARLNLNYLLFAQRTDILENLFHIWGLRTNEAKAVIDSLADWVDEDNSKRLNGAEKPQYEMTNRIGLPRNKPLENLDELELVKNWDKITQIQPAWRDYFTLLGEGRVNINEANSEILQAIFNCSPEQAETIIKQRNGQDGIPYTDDDKPIKDINELQILANLNNQQILSAQALVSYSGNIRRILSVGKVGNYVKKIQAIIYVPSIPLRYFEWREL